MKINSAPFMLRGVARRIDEDGNKDGQVDREEAQKYIDFQMLVSSHSGRSTFIIGDIFPFLDANRRAGKAVGKEIAKAQRLLEKL